MKHIYAQLVALILALAMTQAASATVPVRILKIHTVALAYHACVDVSSSFGIAFFRDATIKGAAHWPKGYWPKGFGDCPAIMHAWNVATSEHEMQVWERRHAQDGRRVHEAMRILNAIKYAHRAVSEIHCVEHGTECRRSHGIALRPLSRADLPKSLRWSAFNAAAAKAAADAARETTRQMKEPKP